MTIPLDITFKGMDPSPAVEARVRERAARLERFHPRIGHCTAVVEAPHRHRHKGRIYGVRLHVRIPGADIVVNHEPGKDHAHEDVMVAVRDAFDAMERRLHEQAERRRGDAAAAKDEA